MAQLPDSGERRSFSTGSVRDKVDGKGAYHLMSPFPILQYALRMEDGMSKYGERNWEKGQPVMQFFNSGVRHLFNFLEDCMLGVEPKEDHLGAALWNIGGMVHTLKMIDHGLLPEELDDRPFPDRVLAVKAQEPEEQKRTTDAVEILRKRFGYPCTREDSTAPMCGAYVDGRCMEEFPCGTAPDEVEEEEIPACEDCDDKDTGMFDEPCWSCADGDMFIPKQEEGPVDPTKPLSTPQYQDLMRHVYQQHPGLIRRGCHTCWFNDAEGEEGCTRILGPCKSDVDFELWLFKYAPDV